jgi:phosphoglycolate phosphatase
MQDGYFEAVLFDLDGTLVDTAPDMVAVLQAMQAGHGREPVAYALGRSQVSNGALGLLRLGFPDLEIDFGDELHQEYLERYAETICESSRVFAGLDALLDRLDAEGCPWGVVTNKPEYLTNPLLDALGLAARSACTVSGDALPVRKPDPAPLLLACDMAGVDAWRSIYVGDASRDIEAGLRAGMATVAATYGYISDDDDPREWGADIIATDTEELTQIVLKAVNLGSDDVVLD